MAWQWDSHSRPFKKSYGDIALADEATGNIGSSLYLRLVYQDVSQSSHSPIAD